MYVIKDALGRFFAGYQNFQPTFTSDQKMAGPYDYRDATQIAHEFNRKCGGGQFTCEWYDAGKHPAEELTCILTAENMHTADDCTTHDHEAFTAKQPAGYRYENIARDLPLGSEIKSPKDGDRAKSYTGVILVFKCGQWHYG